jgi:hypothetical protein
LIFIISDYQRSSAVSSEVIRLRLMKFTPNPFPMPRGRNCSTDPTRLGMSRADGRRCPHIFVPQPAFSARRAVGPLRMQRQPATAPRLDDVRTPDLSCATLVHAAT